MSKTASWTHDRSLAWGNILSRVEKILCSPFLATKSTAGSDTSVTATVNAMANSFTSIPRAQFVSEILRHELSKNLAIISYQKMLLIFWNHSFSGMCVPFPNFAKASGDCK